MIVNETDERFYLAESTIPGAGLGLFAKVPLARGDRFAVIGVLIQRDTETDRCTYYADEHKLRVGDDYLLIPLGYGGMVNHSATPNLEKVTEGTDLFMQAVQDIEAGQELLFTYHPYARERFGLH
jgi:hypothetical protein